MSDRTLDRVITGVFVTVGVVFIVAFGVAMFGVIGAATWAVTPL